MPGGLEALQISAFQMEGSVMLGGMAPTSVRTPVTVASISPESKTVQRPRVGSSVNHCHLTNEKGQDRLLKVGTHVLGLKILNCYLVRRRLKTASGMCWKENGLERAIE